MIKKSTDMKHTPGPWKIVYDGHHKAWYIYGSEGVSDLIAKVLSGKDDAKLLSAAHDLLEACLRAKDYLTTKYPKEADIFNELEAAIKKATE